MKWLSRVFVSWLPLAVAITGICLLVYAAVQQNYRQTLNDPQVQMAEDAGYALAHGEVPAAVVPRTTLIDMRLSLAPWIAVYDNNGTTLEASAFVDGAPPKVPMGVLEAAANGKGKDSPNPDENRVTWEPASGLRQAIVVIAVPGDNTTKYYVVAGRNMREVEDREGSLGMFVLLAWIALLVATFATKAFTKYIS